MKNFLSNNEEFTPKCVVIICTLGDQGSILLRKRSTLLFPTTTTTDTSTTTTTPTDLESIKIDPDNNQKPSWISYLSNLHQTSHNFPISITYSNELDSEYQIIRYS